MIAFRQVHTLFIILIIVLQCEGKINRNEEEFLNFGANKKSDVFETGLEDDSENAVLKSKVEVLGRIFKERIDEIKAKNKKLDLIFLIDASSSIGEVNFQNELKFVKKLLSDIVVDYNHSRVAVVTFSSSEKIVSMYGNYYIYWIKLCICLYKMVLAVIVRI